MEADEFQPTRSDTYDRQSHPRHQINGCRAAAHQFPHDGINDTCEMQISASGDVNNEDTVVVMSA